MRTTPAAQSWPRPERSSSRFGLTTIAVRQHFRRLVMIDDDRVEPERLCAIQGDVARRAAIDADEQARALLAQHLDRGDVRAVALENAVGDVDETRTARRIEKAREQRRRTGAVDVVIAENRHRLAPLDRMNEPRHRRFHSLQRERLGHQRANRRVEILNGALVGDAAPGKHARKDIGMAVRLRDGERPRFAGDVEPRPPRPAQRGGRYAEDEAILRGPQSRLAGTLALAQRGLWSQVLIIPRRASASDTGGIDCQRALQGRTLEAAVEIGAESRRRLRRS